MKRKVFVNFPVEDIDKSVVFYEKLGFQKNEEFSNKQASFWSWLSWLVFFRLKLLSVYRLDQSLWSSILVNDSQRINHVLTRLILLIASFNRSISTMAN